MLKNNDHFHGDFFEMNACGDLFGPDEHMGNTLRNRSDDVKGFLMALRGPSGDRS